VFSTELPGYKPPSAHHVYTECPRDVTSCRDVSTSHVTPYHRFNHQQQQDHQRRGDCIAGAYCESGLYEDDSGQCHALHQCPCEDSGLYYQPGDVIHRSCADW